MQSLLMLNMITLRPGALDTHTLTSKSPSILRPTGRDKGRADKETEPMNS